MEEQKTGGEDPTKEQIILEAAMDIFVEKGWSGARMQEIADRAGINKALLHYYFRSKENIYDKIIESVLSRFFSEMNQELQTDQSFEQVIRQFIYGVVAAINANPRIPMFIISELSRGGKNVQGILASMVDQYGVSLPQRMFALIRRESESGSIRPIDPPQLMITLLGSCLFYFVAEPLVIEILNHVQPQADYDRARFIEQRKESIFDVIYYGLKAREESPNA